jgi:cell division protein FtsW (lipid II flippase)
MNNKTLSAVTLGCFIIALAVGLIVYYATDYGLTMILWTVLLIFGISIFAISFAYSGERGKFGPSESSYRMVVGILAAAVGLIGMLYIVTDISLLILAAIFLIVLALVVIVVALMNGKKEGQ